MFNLIKQKRRTILVVIITLIAIVNVAVVVISYGVERSRQSALEIVGKKAVDKVSFFVDKDYFDDMPAFTYESIDAASGGKFSGFLLDIYKTADKKIVCASDENLKNIVGIDGKIGDLKYYDLLNYNLVFDNEVTSYPIMMCEDLTRHCIEMALTPIIFPHGIDSTRDIENILKSYEYSDSIILMSDSFDLIHEAYSKYPQIKLWYLVDEATDEEIEKLNLLPNAEIIFNAQNKKNNEDVVEKINAKEISFGCCNVNKRSLLKKYVAIGASEIITSRFVKSN